MNARTRSQLGDTAVNQMGEVLGVWKLKGRLKLNNPLEEGLIGPADSGGLGHKEARRAG